MIKHLLSLIGCTLSMGASISNAVIEVPHNIYNPPLVDSLKFDFAGFDVSDYFVAGFFNVKYYFNVDSVVTNGNYFRLALSEPWISTNNIGGSIAQSGEEDTSFHNLLMSCSAQSNSGNNAVEYTSYDICVGFTGWMSSSNASCDLFASVFFSDKFAGFYIDYNSYEVSSLFNLHSFNYLTEDVVYSEFQRCYIGGSRTQNRLMNFTSIYQCVYSTSSTSTYGASDFRISFDIYHEYGIGDSFAGNGVYQTGFNDGYNRGYQDGRSAGYNDGYADGVNDGGMTSSSFLKMMGAIADVPVRMITSLYSFDLFGISALTIFMSLMTMLVVFFLIRKYLL